MTTNTNNQREDVKPLYKTLYEKVTGDNFNDEAKKALDQYRELAVENFAGICEALENVLWNFEGKDNLTPVQQAAIKYCKEELNKIS